MMMLIDDEQTMQCRGETFASHRTVLQMRRFRTMEHLFLLLFSVCDSVSHPAMNGRVTLGGIQIFHRQVRLCLICRRG